MARRPPRQGGVTLPRRHVDSDRRACPQDWRIESADQLDADAAAGIEERRYCPDDEPIVAQCIRSWANI